MQVTLRLRSDGNLLFSSCLDVLSRRVKLLALLNLAFFSCVLTGVLVSDLLYPSPPLIDSSPPFPQQAVGNVAYVFLFIFLFNLVVSGFTVVTLPGFAFFPLSTVFLVYRALLWGLLLHGQASWLFLAALPTLVLEGEAYVLAALAGTIIGASWIEPALLYGKDVTGRAGALKRAASECFYVYLLVVAFLFFAAVVETVTLLLINK